MRKTWCGTHVQTTERFWPVMRNTHPPENTELFRPAIERTRLKVRKIRFIISAHALPHGRIPTLHNPTLVTQRFNLTSVRQQARTCRDTVTFKSCQVFLKRLFAWTAMSHTEVRSQTIRVDCNRYIRYTEVRSQTIRVHCNRYIRYTEFCQKSRLQTFVNFGHKQYYKIWFRTWPYDVCKPCVLQNDISNAHAV